MSHFRPPDGIRNLLRATLTERTRAGDRHVADAVRQALAAIDDAGIAPEEGAGSGDRTETVPPAPGATQPPRRELDEDEQRAVVRAEAERFAELSRRSGEAGASDAARVAFEQATALRFLLDVARGA